MFGTVRALVWHLPAGGFAFAFLILFVPACVEALRQGMSKAKRTKKRKYIVSDFI